MRSRIKSTLTLAALLITAWASLATSKRPSSAAVTNGTLYINSDCVSPAREAVITTVAGQISTPPGTVYTDFGFPLNIVSLTSNNSGLVNGLMRECFLTYGDTDDGDDFIFSCHDAGSYVCSIILQKY